jgi:acyl-ACP thioesterase
MVEPPPGARVFMLPRRPGLADCAPSGRVRLDAIARFLQDVAYADVEDAGVAEAAVWVVRRTRLRVERFPRFAEHLELRTFCSGIGRMWAERRSSIGRPGRPADVEAVSLWVHLDPEQRRPTRLTEREIAVYGGTGADRRVSARLRHPLPDSDGGGVAWAFRATDCDLADHVNNAAYWEPLEERLLAEPEPVRIDVEIEFRSPAQPGEKRILADGPRLWIADAEGEIHASMVVLLVDR